MYKNFYKSQLNKMYRRHTKYIDVIPECTSTENQT